MVTHGDRKNSLPEISSNFNAVMNVLYHILEVRQNVKSFSNLVASPPGISGRLVKGMSLEFLFQGGVETDDKKFAIFVFGTIVRGGNQKFQYEVGVGSTDLNN